MLLPLSVDEKRICPAKSRIVEPAQETKVFCFFSSEKKNLLFLKKKKQKDFYFSGCFTMLGR